MPRISRRAAISTLVFGVAGGAAYFAYATRVNSGDGTMTPDEAFAAVSKRRLILIDVRRPDEWARTGTAPGALKIDMRRADFIGAVQQAANAQPNLPVAFICARGVRSRHVTEQLLAAGLTNIVDIPEGMLGSRAGPGWLKRDLPVVPHQG